MITDLPIPSTPDSPSPSPLDSRLQTQDPPTTAPDKQLHRKVPKLPKILRDRVNSMLDDSLPYPQIVASLQQSTNPPLPYPISEMDLSRWKNGGYQHYLAQQDRLEVLR